MADTVQGMGRKRKNADPAPAEAGGTKNTGLIRVEPDIAQMLAIIAAVTGESIKDIVSPALRPFVEKRYAEAKKQLDRLGGGREGA